MAGGQVIGASDAVKLMTLDRCFNKLGIVRVTQEYTLCNVRIAGFENTLPESANTLQYG